MNKEQQRKFYERKLEVLEQDYNRVRATTNALRCDISDLSFDERVQDPQERYLMVEKLKTLEGVQTNMLNLIRFYRHKVEANKPEPWEECNAIRTVESPCGPVRVVDHDKITKEELCEMTHHCGQDADMDDACCQARGHQPEGYTYKDLLGMEVICYGGKAMKCEGCSWECDNCVKVELAGGDYICLAKPQEDERPVINFDEEESNVMVDIREKTEAFMDYLESVVKSRTHGLG